MLLAVEGHMALHVRLRRVCSTDLSSLYLLSFTPCVVRLCSTDVSVMTLTLLQNSNVLFQRTA